MTVEHFTNADHEPVTPQWSIAPREHEHAPLGRPPFDILFIPETSGVIRPENIFANTEGQPRKTDKRELEDSIYLAIEARKKSVAAANADLEKQLGAKGVAREEIEERKIRFFDGRLVRLHPHDFGVNGGNNLFLRLGETTYFTYVGTRDREALPKYGYDRLGLPLAVCSVLTAPSENGTEKLLYTVRTTNEAYPGWYHGVAGTIEAMHNGTPNPSAALRREIQQELGLSSDEFHVDGVLGLIKSNPDVHLELTYKTTVQSPIEVWYKQRETDKEVDVEFFTDTPDNLANFILGQPFDEVPDARPVVPAGVAGYLFYGRLKYGQDWYNKVYKKLPQY
jgi:8-oxo-dGTP pyrophosphatase MutT (NUDIX family)